MGNMSTIVHHRGAISIYDCNKGGENKNSRPLFSFKPKVAAQGVDDIQLTKEHTTAFDITLQSMSMSTYKRAGM